MNADEFKALIEKIYKENSLTIIDYTCDKAWSNDPLFDSQKKILHEIQRTNDLDHIQLECAVFLGLEKEATELRAWLLKKPKKTGLYS